MNAIVRRNFLIFFAGFALSAAAWADTNSPAAPASPDVANGLLQVQQQLHDTQLTMEHNWQQAQVEARRNADDVAARLQDLQQSIANQRQREIETTQKTQQHILVLGGVFGVIGLAVLLVMAYLQWRAVSRLLELVSLRPADLVLEAGQRPAALIGNAGVEQSNTRLFAMVDHLEKRILELKEVAQAPLKSPEPSAVPETNGAPKTASDRDECVANLMTEGQALLDANEPRRALECFDTALNLHPKHPEALVKRGGALEKLGRLDEAIACYDQAIEADGGMTIAYLHKGGLFNRLSRYDEALQCYERALQTQEKRAPAEKALA